MLQELDGIDDPVERLRRDFHMRLDAVQKFDPIVRMVDAGNSERFPELRKSFTAGLELDQWQLGWERPPSSRSRHGRARRATASSRSSRTVPTASIPADEFIDELVAMLTSADVVPPVREH